MELYDLTIHELHEKLKKKEITSLELTESFLKRIDAVDGKIKAYITVTKEDAIKQAIEADKRIASGKGVTPLTGVPISAKDIFCTKGILTTCASKIVKISITP